MRSEASCDESSSGMPGLLGLSLQRRQPLLIFAVIVLTELLSECGCQATLQSRGRLANGLQRGLGFLVRCFSVERPPLFLCRVDAFLSQFGRLGLGICRFLRSRRLRVDQLLI